MPDDPVPNMFIGLPEEAIELALDPTHKVAQAIGRLHATGIGELMEAWATAEIERDTPPAVLIGALCAHSASMVGSMMIPVIKPGREADAIAGVVADFQHQLEMFVKHAIPELRARGLIDDAPISGGE